MSKVTTPSTATYWVRETSTNKWFKTSVGTADEILRIPKGSSEPSVKIGRQVRQISVLSAMPSMYKSKSDVERGLGVVIWDWGLGPITKTRVAAAIDRLVGDDLRRSELSGAERPKWVQRFLTLKHGLVGSAGSGAAPRVPGGMTVTLKVGKDTWGAKKIGDGVGYYRVEKVHDVYGGGFKWERMDPFYMPSGVERKLDKKLFGSIEGQRTRSGGVMHVKTEPTRAAVSAAHKRRLARKSKATVRKQGTKWLLKMHGEEACFSTKREAKELADMLNDMTPAEAKKAMGI